MFFRYSKWDRSSTGSMAFERLLDLFQQLLYHTGGDAAEALHWLTQLDRQHGVSDDGMGIGDFIEELKNRGYLEQDEARRGELQLTAKTERALRERSLEEIFTQLRKSRRGGHRPPTQVPATSASRKRGRSSSATASRTSTSRDPLERVPPRRRGRVPLDEEDLRGVRDGPPHGRGNGPHDRPLHSMMLYGEDRITPARKTAMALAELITTRYPKDTLDIVAFGNDAWEVEIKDLPYLRVGPFHTNTRAGLQRARQILRRRKNRNKQVFMITDGKPSAHFESGRLYKNSFGLDRKIVNKVLDEAAICRREGVTITTFMIARDPYLQQFVRQLTETNHGRAYYARLDDLGGFLFEDYVRNRRKGVR
jgi:Ca-activated chloride channel homolog